MSDGTALPEPVAVEVSCGRAFVTVARTNSKGGFILGGARDLTMADASVGRSARTAPGDSQLSSRSSAARPGCLVRAHLPGYRSTTLTVVSSTDFDLGTIVFHRIAEVEGTTVSATSLAAPKKAQQAYEKGKKASEKHKWAEATRQLELAVQIYAQHAGAWCELGRVRQATGDLAGAEQACRTSISADPKLITPYLQLASILATAENWVELEKVSGAAVKLNPFEFPSAWVYSAMAKVRLGDNDGAQKAALQAIKLDTDHEFPEVEYILAIALANAGKLQAAAEHMRAYVTLAPTAANAEVARGQLRQFESAVAAAAQANK